MIRQEIVICQKCGALKELTEKCECCDKEDVASEKRELARKPSRRRCSYGC